MIVDDDAPMDAALRPTGTVAFLFTDVEGSTATWDAEPAAMAEAVARLERILDGSATAGHRAVEQGGGDSAVIAFERVSDAAAAAVTSAVAIAKEAWPTSEPIRVRMALHVGEVAIDAEGCYRGPTMNRCGRLLAAAHGGQIVASGPFVGLLPDRDEQLDGALTGLSWTDLGEHHLRGIESAMQVWQAVHPDLAAEHPPLRTPEGRGLQLPGTTSSLIGREREVETLCALVAEDRVVTVTGSGGSGKTRLAVEAARQAIEVFADVAWVDLAKLGGGDRIEPLAVAALGLHHGPSDPRRRLVGHLRPLRALLVFDNCEHVLGGVAELIEVLVEQCPSLHVLATSREPLEVAGEALLRLGPLDVPDDGSELLGSASGMLFADRVQRARSGRALVESELADAAEICRRLDGIPLALELAAARARSMPLQAIADRLKERFALLVGGRRSTLARQRTLEASVAWSYDLLEESEQAALRHLAACAGPFDLVAAEALVAVDGVAAVTLVAALVDKSLLLDESHHGTARYRILETVRFYARDRSVQASDAAASRDRHLRWVLEEVDGMATRFESSEAAVSVTRIDAILDEVRAAMEWALSSGRSDDVLRIGSSLGWYWVWRGLGGEAIEWFDRAQNAAGRPTEDVQVAAAVGFARHNAVAHHQPEHDKIERAASAGIAAARAAGDLGTEARCRLLLEVHRSFHDPVGRRPALQAAAELCREHGGPYWATMADVLVAQSQLFQQELSGPDALVASAERAALSVGNHQLICEAMARRCAIAEGLGDYDGAVAAMETLDSAVADVATRDIRAMALRSVSLVELQRGDVDGVIDRLRVALDRYLQDEDAQFVPLITDPLANALVASGLPEEAVGLLDPVWNHPEIRTSRVYVPMVSAPYAEALWAAGDRTTARHVVALALEDARAIEADVVVAWLGLLDGRFDLDEAKTSPAEAKLHSALCALHDAGRRQHVCDALEAIARLELHFGRAQAAALLLGAASRERDAQGVVLRPTHQASYVESIELARSELGEERFADHWARARQLTIGEAVDLAERGRGERTRPAAGWDALTGTELRVATLATEGLTNRQIAERLIVGQETVKSHMASILRKLSLTNRTQLARAMSDRSRHPHP